MSGGLPVFFIWQWFGSFASVAFCSFGKINVFTLWTFPITFSDDWRFLDVWWETAWGSGCGFQC